MVGNSRRLLGRVPSEVSGLFADEMDLQSLSNWRTTCHHNYMHGTSSLRRTLTRRIHAFTLDPSRLVTAVTEHSAVFGGEIALSFMLRTDAYRPACIEIFTGRFQFESLCDAILDDPAVQARMETHSFLTHTLFHALRRLVAQTLVIHLTKGMAIYVYQSYTSSPVAPISRAVCTAFSNFVTGYGYGFSHPELSLARRALLADRELLHLSHHDAHCLNRLLRSGFSLAVSPTAWPEYRRHSNGDTLDGAEECWRERFICPNQGRYFGDGGSLVGFFDPLGDDKAVCMERRMAPFGPMCIWRIRTTFDCESACRYGDGVMERVHTSVPALFDKDPRGEMRDCVAEDSTDILPYCRRFGRRRAWSL